VANWGGTRLKTFLCFEPFHLGAEFLTELPTLTCKLLGKRLSKHNGCLFGIMLDDTIHSAISNSHEFEARRYASERLCDNVFFVYESDLTPLATALITKIDPKYLDDKPKVVKLLPPWTSTPIRLLAIDRNAPIQSKDLFSGTTQIAQIDAYPVLKPTCSMFIVAWNYLRCFSEYDELKSLIGADRQKAKQLIINKAEDLLRRENNKIARGGGAILNFLNRSYKNPEQQGRIIAYFLNEDLLRTTLSNSRTIETEFYSLFDADEIIEA